MKNGSDYRIGFKIAVGLAQFNQKTFQTLTLFADFFIFQKLFILFFINSSIIKNLDNLIKITDLNYQFML